MSSSTPRSFASHVSRLESLVTPLASALILNTILKGWFAGEACAQLAEDRRIGALELLLSTPLDVRSILHGQFLALCR